MTFVRIKDPATGHEFTVSDVQADAVKAKPLDKPAVDASGRPLPPTYHRTIDEAAAAARKGA